MKKSFKPKLSRFIVSLFFLGMLTSLASCKTNSDLITKTKMQQVKTKQKFNELVKEGNKSTNEYYDTIAGGDAVPESDTGAGTKGRDFTGTNEQVAGVSEADIIKTDGYQIYYLARERGALQVFDVADDKSITLSKSLTFADSYGIGMYLLPEYVVVISEKYEYVLLPEYEEFWLPGWFGYATTAITVIERTNHQVVYELNIKDNIIIDHRVIDNNLFLVGYEYITIDEEDPRPEISLLDGTETNIGYNDIYYFEDTPVHGMTKIIGLKLAADPQAITFNAKGFLGANYGYKQVYVSQTDLYLCDSNWLFTENSYYSTLTISQFELDLDKANINYVAAAIVDGSMLNQFSMVYYNGHLRVATTNIGVSWLFDEENYISTWSQVVINHLYVLKVNKRTKTFTLVGHLSEGLGKPNETIKSVRFLGDKAYIVTFETRDPLYIIDLSNPAKPVITGDIELPGYDVYQHPFGDSFVLGLGYSADDDGFTSGIKLTAYATSAGNEHEIQTYIVSTYRYESAENYWSYSYGFTEALWNHKAMLISVKDGVFAFPYFEYGFSCSYERDGDSYVSSDCQQSFSFNYQIYNIDFSRETPIAEPIKISHPAVEEYVYPINRSVLIEGVLYIFSTYHVSTYDLATKISTAPVYIA